MAAKSESKSYYKPREGDYVERQLEGVWFPATVESVDLRAQQAVIKYLDDDNVEKGVSFEDLRQSESKDAKGGAVHSVRDTLPKPLAGLIDDDCEARLRHVPKVTIHNTTESEEAIILNGAENKLAAGGGLRALRYLKN
jgi:hypothetical protein